MLLFFFNDTATTEIYTLSLHDALPISDSSIRVEKVVTGLETPTSMAFLDNDDIIITQKDNGMVRLVSNGILQPQPILEVPVANNSERGLLGVAIANATSVGSSSRSEEHTSELQSRQYLVCRLL